MSENRIRLLIRAKVEAGLLPAGPNRETYGRRGGTGTCSCCDTAIGALEVEYEVHFFSGQMLLVHMNCYRIWREEWTGIRPSLAPERCEKRGPEVVSRML